MSRLMWGMMLGAAVMMAATETYAQQEGQGPRRGGRGGFGGGFGGMSNLGLLRGEKIQAELKITAEQKTKIEELQAANRPAPGARGNFADLRNLGEEERNAKLAELRKTREAATAETNKKVDSILDEAQRTRLKEISLQLRGLGALRDAEVATALKLTDEQKTQLTKIDEEASAARRELFGTGGEGGNREGIREKMEAARKAQEEKTVAVLTAEQKAAWEKMLGAKIDREQLFPRGERGGNNAGGTPRRRPGNNNNNNN